MPDIIRLLPDTVANQIAAGEVVQRPASAVKELLENAVDAGATEIRLVIKDSGKTLIQVSDNGKGMSETDARMSFERHATSKISTADDLFAIKTKGFRGEALASIAAVAQVELKTRREEDELGTQIIIEGGEVKSQEPCQCARGSVFIIKNLFYNIPARRKFLKTDGVEFRHIIEEFERVALAHPEVSFLLSHNGTEVFHLDRGNGNTAQAALRQRITSVFGNPYNQRLAPLEETTDMVVVSGFIGKPEFAKKSRGEQFFFLNKRYIKNNYLHHAVVSAFEQLLPPDAHPTYFIFLEMAPSSFDVNIHPTKTEVKFEDERLVYAILRSVVKKSLGQYNIAPTLDFEQEMSLKDIPLHPENGQVQQPGIHVNPNFNPFESDTKKNGGQQEWQRMDRHVSKDWQQMFSSHITGETSTEQVELPSETQGQIMPSSWDEEEKTTAASGCHQLHGRYVLTHIKSGLMIIDQQRAHERILYERYVKALQQHNGHCQQKLFPETVSLSPVDAALAAELAETINTLGFDIRPFGQHTFVIHGVPAGTEDRDVKKLLEGLLEAFKQNQQDLKLDTGDNLARSLARQTSIKPGKSLSETEMRALVDELFACALPYSAPDGKPTMITYSIEDLDRRFKR